MKTEREWQSFVLIFVTAVLFTACRNRELQQGPGNGQIIPVESEQKVRADADRIVDPDGNPLLLRCVNIDGWLLPIPYLASDSGNALLTSPSEFAARLDNVVGEERAAEFWEQWRDAFITEADFERIAELGFNCARIVVYHRAITKSPDYDQLDPKRLQRLDRALEWALNHNVYVVLDLHSLPGGQNSVSTVSDVPASDTTARLWEGDDVASNKSKSVALWRGLAERYEDRVVVAGYDLMNEPALPASVEKTDLPALYRDMATAIREVDSDHLLFIEGDKLAHDFSMFDAPVDDNMAYSFHGYALTGFEDFADPDPGDIADFVSLRESQNVPLWLGEFGEGTANWQTEMIELVEAENIGWAVYPWKRKQTWFYNPVLQRIEPSSSWYDVAKYLAQPPSSNMATPSVDAAEKGMGEILNLIRLENCTEDFSLADRLIR